MLTPLPELLSNLAVALTMLERGQITEITIYRTLYDPNTGRTVYENLWAFFALLEPHRVAVAGNFRHGRPDQQPLYFNPASKEQMTKILELIEVSYMRESAIMKNNQGIKRPFYDEYFTQVNHKGTKRDGTLP